MDVIDDVEANKNTDVQKEYGVIVNKSISILKGAGLNISDDALFSSEVYSSYSKIIDKFEVPKTTFSPLMRRFMFQFANLKRFHNIFGAGTYVGYPFAWLVAGSLHRCNTIEKFSATGVDINVESVCIAKNNFSLLDSSDKVRLIVDDAVAHLQVRSQAIDCLFIDIDSADNRKDEYVNVLLAAFPHMEKGGVIIAHDPCVKLFESGFKSYHQYITDHPHLAMPVVLPLDECGVSISWVV